MDYATGKYLTFVDSDDALAPEFIEKCLEKMEEYDCDVVETAFKYFSKQEEMVTENHGKSYFLDVSIEENRKKFIITSLKTAVWGRLYKRSFLEENNLRFLERIFYEDCHFTGLSMLYVNRYYMLGESLYFYFKNPTGIIKQSGNTERVKQELDVEVKLLQDIRERKLLPNSLEPYQKELEFYVTYKGFMDGMIYLYNANGEIPQDVFMYLRDGIMKLMPGCLENRYLQNMPNWDFYSGLLLAGRSESQKLFANKKPGSIILLNTHDYINVGDHLITLSEEIFFEQLRKDNPDIGEVIEVTGTVLIRERYLLKKYISSDDILVITGGGFLGSLWLEKGETSVRNILEDYPDNRIIIFPQTLYFEENDFGIRQMQITQRCYSAHKNLTVCLRDKASYRMAKKLFGEKVKCYYIPDMALLLNMSGQSEHREGVRFCFRNDKERIFSEEALSLMKKLIEESFKEKETEYIQTDMLLNMPMDMSSREEIVCDKLSEFASAKLVITDRLHCMLSCAITGTPCIAFDNLSHKVSGVYEWIKELSYIKVLAADKENTIDKIKEVLEQIDIEKEYIYECEAVDKAFEQLGEIVCNREMIEEPVWFGEEYCKFIDLYVNTENCNFRCSYCYIAQQRRFRDNLFELNRDVEEIRKAFSRKHLGGKCFINLCAGGETLLSGDVVLVAKVLLEEGHVVQIVTNGTPTKSFILLSQLQLDFKDRLFIKFSFHYLELKRQNSFEIFWANVHRIEESGISFTVEVVTDDALIPYIDEVKEMVKCEMHGVLPHITIARDDRKANIDLLTEMEPEEYFKIWGQFDSNLFLYKKQLFGVKRKEFCHAGERTFSVNLGTGSIHQCICHEEIGNIYDESKPFPIKPVGNHCRLAYCFNGHSYIPLGAIDEIGGATYFDVRDRIDNRGKHWVSGEVKKCFEQRIK